MSGHIESIKFPDHPLADGTIPSLLVTTWIDEGKAMSIHDELETWNWLSSINSPMSTDDIELRLDFDGCLPTPEQTQKILNAMAGLIQAISEVGYEMAQTAHERAE